MHTKEDITEIEAQNINLRSEEVRDIMGKIPSRIIQYGISVIFLIIVAIFCFSFIFKYPDVISGNFVLQTVNPPAFLLAKSSGKLQSLFVNNGDTVKTGDLLAIIENPASFEGYQSIKQLINQNMEPSIVGTKLDSMMKNGVRFGELQVSLASWLKSIDDYNAYKKTQYFPTKQKAIESKIRDMQIHGLLLSSQLDASKKNYELAIRANKRDSLLYSEKVIATLDIENSQKELLSQKMALTNAEIALSNARLTLSEYQQQKAELLITEQQTTSSQLALIRQNHENVKSSMADWENHYGIFSPINGVVAFSGIWKKNQNITLGQHVITVVPNYRTEIVGRVYIATARAGKVKPNQPVNLKFSDFPYREYGMIVGKLKDLSAVPDSVYVGTILLPDTLVTNYGKILPFKQNMQGVAEIITEDISLAERLIYPLKAIFKNNIE